MIAKTILYVYTKFLRYCVYISGNCGHHRDNGDTYYKA